MKGIASFLAPPADRAVRELWQELESACGLAGAQSTFFPHLTWQVTEDYDADRLDGILRAVCKETASFTIRTGGLGLFTGQKPVVYLPIFKDAALIRFHATLWELTRASAVEPWSFYTPAEWVPHITLAYNDVNADNLGCVLRALAFRDLRWEIRIENLVAFSQESDQTTSEVIYPFGG